MNNFTVQTKLSNLLEHLKISLNIKSKNNIFLNLHTLLSPALKLLIANKNATKHCIARFFFPHHWMRQAFGIHFNFHHRTRYNFKMNIAHKRWFTLQHLRIRQISRLARPTPRFKWQRAGIIRRICVCIHITHARGRGTSAIQRLVTRDTWPMVANCSFPPPRKDSVTTYPHLAHVGSAGPFYYII